MTVVVSRVRPHGTTIDGDGVRGNGLHRIEIIIDTIGEDYEPIPLICVPWHFSFPLKSNAEAWTDARKRYDKRQGVTRG